MKRFVTLFSLLVAALAAPLTHALTEVVDGIEWNYDVQSHDWDENGESYDLGYNVAQILYRDWDDASPSIDPNTRGAIVVPEKLGGYEVRHIGHFAFRNCAFITSLVFPASITSLAPNVFRGTTRLRDVTFLGDVPRDFSVGEFREGVKIFFPRKYGANWEKVLKGTSLRGGWIESGSAPTVQASFPIASSTTVFRVPYTVTSTHGNTTVEVRLIAFLNGKRTLENLIVATSPYVSGVGVVPVGMEQTLSWKMLEDLRPLSLTDMARLKMELLVKDGDVLPKETVVIPAMVENGVSQPEHIITRNGLSETQVYQALLWYLAEKDSRLSISGNASLVDGQKVFEDGNFGFNDTLLLNYLYGKEGYALLEGDTLESVERILGTTFPRSGLGQIAIKQ